MIIIPPTREELGTLCHEFEAVFDDTLNAYGKYLYPEIAPAHVRSRVKKFVTSTGRTLAIIERALLKGELQYTDEIELSLLFLHQARLGCIAWLQRRLPDAEKRVAA